MDEEEDDDIYASAGTINGAAIRPNITGDTIRPNTAAADLEDGEEEGEEVEEVEEDDSDSDIDIITERKDAPRHEPKHEPHPSQKTAAAKPTPVRTVANEPVKPSPSPAIKVEAPNKPQATPPRSGASYPPVKTSKLDVDARPIYEPNGKPITDIDMDADFPEDDKPWRRPGTDMTDFFNYGFDEFTWASYCLKQETIRKDAADSKKQMEDMQSFLGMPGAMPGAMPAMPGMPGAPGMGGSGEMPPEMNQMMQQMMASGMDPSQMSPDMFMQYMMQGTGGQAGMAGYGQQGQGQGQQQMGYGYGGGGGQGGGGGGGGGGRRGRGGRNW